MVFACSLFTKILTSKIALILLLHATATLDAGTTNRLFNRLPPGYRAYESNPMMRPFAGKRSMYLAINLSYIPLDIALIKSRRHEKIVKAWAAGAIGWEIFLANRNHRRMRAGWEGYGQSLAAPTLPPHATATLDIDAAVVIPYRTE